MIRVINFRNFLLIGSCVFSKMVCFDECARLLHESSSKLRLAKPDIATISHSGHTKYSSLGNMRSAVWEHFKKGKDDAECKHWQNRKEQGGKHNKPYGTSQDKSLYGLQ